MKTRIFLPVLAFAGLLSLAASQCDISMRETDQPFPDILKNVGDTYIMAVEYTIPVSKQTDYYTEYYDIIEKDGRLDSHISGKNQKYIYYADTQESWTIDDTSCKFAYTNETAEFFKSDQTDWKYVNNTFYPTTIGPSAMFKTALHIWKTQLTDDRREMAYMGKSKDLIRGELAVYWRRCTNDGKDFVDYYFTDPIEETAFQSEDSSLTPLRVAYYGVSEEEDEELSYQFYDVIYFQNFIQLEMDAFGLPKGMDCKRRDLDYNPDPPDFTQNDIYLSSEVLYERFSTKDNGKDLMAGYYSTLTFALNRKTNHLAYYVSQWNNTKPNKDEDQAPKGKPARKIIYDGNHAYLYNISTESGKCTIDRRESYVPQYVLPEGRGSIAITDSSVLLPDKERKLKFLTEGKVRGLDVNIFEMVDNDLKIGDEKTLDKVVVTHSYLRAYEELENIVSVTEAPVQMEVRIYRTDNTLEVLTFNIFSFRPRLRRRSYLLDLSSCFPNDNDYSYLTIGFEIEPKMLPEVQKKLPEFEGAVIDTLTGRRINPIRVPKVMTDVKDNYVYVTALILNRPPFKFEFPKNESGKSIKDVPADNIQGIATFDTCAQNCLEVKSECWGFSMCGSTCYYGTPGITTVENKNDCNLYTKYSNDSAILSNEFLLSNIVNEVEAEEFKIILGLSSGMETLTATIVQKTDPAEDDSLYDKMGNRLNNRMRVVKAGAKLKTGDSIKNLGSLRYDECQSVCLDFKDCETVSFCLDKSECVISSTYAADLKPEDKEENQLCNLLARQYTDHFERTPGLTLSVKGKVTLDLSDVQDCARACLKQDKFDCLSFDHCNGGDNQGCTLHTTHYINPKDRKEDMKIGVTCGHYSRKFSHEFARKDQTQVSGSKLESMLNMTLEECAKACVEYGKGTCYGYDFCQDQSLYATSCTLFDTDPSRLDSGYSPRCTHFARTAPEFEARPFSNGYAGGIGFLCFLIGGLLGAGVVFVIAYVRVNRMN